MRVSVVLLAAVVPAVAGAAVLEHVDVSLDPTPSVRLILSESAPAERTGHALAADGTLPARFYVDLSGTTLAPEVRGTVAGAGPVLRVRTGQFDPGTARVVIDLANAMPAAVRTEGRTVTIELEPAASASGAAPAVTRVVTRVVTPPPPLAAGPSRVRPSTPGTAAAATDAATEPAPPSPPVRAPLPAAATPAPVARVRREHPAPATPPSPPPVVASVEPPRPPHAVARAALVVVDAGHGGRDPGAAGIGGVLEKDIVLEFARLLAAKLSERLPVDTLLTRSDDSFVPLTNRLPAPGSHAALFLSLHANACSDPELRGVELFYGGGPLRPASTGGAVNPQAALLGRLLASALRAQIELVREPRAGQFKVLTRNPVPSALIEIGYLTHRGDAERAQDVAYREALTDALVAGVASFLRTTAPRL